LDLDPENAWARHVAFVGVGSPYQIVTSFRKGWLVVYDFDPPAPPKVRFERPLNIVRSSTLVRGRRMVFTRNQDGAVADVGLENAGDPVRVLGTGHRNPAFALHYHADTGAIATGDREGRARFWNAAPESRGWELTKDRLGWSRTGFRSTTGFVGDFVFALGGDDQCSLSIVRAADGEARYTQGPLRAENGRRMAQAVEPFRVGSEVWRKWEPGVWQCLSLAGGEPASVVRLIPYGRGEISAGPLACVADERRGGLVVFSQDMTSTVALIRIDAARAGAARVSPDLRWVACEVSGRVRLFALAAPHDEVTLEADGRVPSKWRPSFAPGGEYLAARSGRSVVVWATATGRKHSTVHSSQALDDAAVTPDGARILGIDAVGRVYVWDARSAALLGTFAAGLPAGRASMELDTSGKRLLLHLERSAPPGDSVRVIHLAD
jgi:WD40 repeat protein